MNTRDKKRLEKKKRRKKIKYVLARGFLYATIAVAFAMGCFFFLIYRDMRGKIRKNLQVEVGTKVVLKNFLWMRRMIVPDMDMDQRVMPLITTYRGCIMWS